MLGALLWPIENIVYIEHTEHIEHFELMERIEHFEHIENIEHIEHRTFWTPWHLWHLQSGLSIRISKNIAKLLFVKLYLSLLSIFIS